MEENLDSVIRSHFNNGLTYTEIIVLMRIEQGIHMSVRQLKRRLNQLKLKRRQQWNHRQVEVAIQTELAGSAGNLGCRSMVTRLLLRHGISVGRDTVLEHLRRLDPEGIERRLSHRLSRREYFNKGPNYLVHVDGYDKIKRFGFAIHGAIDGYSRKVLWLKVGRTNNDPAVIASYFLEWLQENEGVPYCIRMDAGTENVILADIQKAFRWFNNDRRCGEKSVIIGSSHTNQRIECWWRQLHQLCTSAWKEMFSVMEENNVYSTANETHMECVRYCFMQVLQIELDQIRLEWNIHKIRRQNQQEAPQGKPIILFHHPELYGTKDYKMLINMEELTVFREMYPLSDPVSTIATRRALDSLLERGGKSKPDTLQEAQDLLPWILNHID